MPKPRHNWKNADEWVSYCCKHPSVGVISTTPKTEKTNNKPKRKKYKRKHN